MAEDLCTAGANLDGATVGEQVSGSGDPLCQSYHGRSCPAAVSSALPFPLCFLPFFALAESCCESKRVNSHLARKLVQKLYRADPAGNGKVTVHKWKGPCKGANIFYSSYTSLTTGITGFS